MTDDDDDDDDVLLITYDFVQLISPPSSSISIIRRAKDAAITIYH